MTYDHLEEAGMLSVVYSGPPLDLYAVGMLQVNLQEIFDRVAFWLSAEAGLMFPDSRRRGWRGLPAWQPSPRIVRGELRSIATGSLTQEVVFVVARVLSDPDMRAVLQGFSGNVVFAIAASGLRVIRQRSVEATRPVREFWARRPDPADVGPNLRSIIAAVAESVPYGKANISIRSKTSAGEHEVIITIDNEEPST